MSTATQWFAHLEEREVGPITMSQLKQLVNAGRLHPTDLVWTEGMPDWKPASSIQGLFAPTTGPSFGGASDSQNPFSPGQSDEPTGGGMGKSTTNGPGRQPVFQQEGYPSESKIPHNMVVGNIGLRWVGSIIDGMLGFVFSILVMVVVFVLVSLLSMGQPQDVQMGLMMISTFPALMITAVVLCFYEIKATASPMKGTIGKVLVGMGVVDQATGGQLSMGQSTGRCLSKMISQIMMIGYIIALFNPQRESLHDMIAKTYVVKMR